MRTAIQELQWGRGGEAAERWRRGVIGRSRISFNGAAAVRPRKDVMRARRPLMALSFNGATAVRPRKVRSSQTGSCVPK